MKSSEELKLLDGLPKEVLEKIVEELGYHNLNDLKAEDGVEQIGDILNAALRLMDKKEPSPLSSNKLIGSGIRSGSGSALSVGGTKSPSGSHTKSVASAGAGSISPAESVASAGAGSRAESVILGRASPAESVASAGAGIDVSSVLSIAGATMSPEVIARFLDNISSCTNSKGEILDVEGVLPPEVFKELASLCSIYSTHLGKKTVVFKNGELLINEKNASHDKSTDTYGNKSLEVSFFNLQRAIINQAKMYSGKNLEDEVVFVILAMLHREITTFSKDACNQQNAIEFAKKLQEFAPTKSEARGGVLVDSSKFVHKTPARSTKPGGRGGR